MIVTPFSDFEIFKFLFEISIHSWSWTEFKIAKSFTIIPLQDVFEIDGIQITPRKIMEIRDEGIGTWGLGLSLCLGPSSYSL
jgi:hypothetical protein